MTAETYQHDGDVFGQIANATAVLVQSNSIYSSGGSVTLWRIIGADDGPL